MITSILAWILADEYGEEESAVLARAREWASEADRVTPFEGWRDVVSEIDGAVAFRAYREELVRQFLES